MAGDAIGADLPLAIDWGTEFVELDLDLRKAGTSQGIAIG